MKARASTMTMKILRKVSITLFAVDSAPRHTSRGLVHLKPSAALFHAALEGWLLAIPVHERSWSRLSRPRVDVAKARSWDRKPILETLVRNSGRPICVLLPDFGIFSFPGSHGTPSPRS